MHSWYVGYGLAAYVLSAAAVYAITAILIFLMQTQMPVTFGLAMLRSLLWPRIRFSDGRIEDRWTHIGFHAPYYHFGYSDELIQPPRLDETLRAAC